MVVLIFLVGALIGLLAGVATCVRYLRHEIAADVGPRLKGIQIQLDRLDAEVNLALATRLAEIAERYGHEPRLPGAGRIP
jgi:hypothetical protein